MPKRAADLTGQKFNKRLVLGRGAYRERRVYWKARCDCGYHFECTTQALIRGGLCIRCGHKGPRPSRRLRPFEATYNTFVSKARYPVSITYEQFFVLTQFKQCHYCGADLRWAEYSTQAHRMHASNLDRKDNDLPYDIDNVVVCCPRCNRAKNTHFTYEEWMQLAKNIRRWKKEKK